jgi:hypothetical protein
MNTTTTAFQNRALKMVVNVYQLNYVNKEAQGWGDFLRGSVCLFQICQSIGVAFDIDVRNHPLGALLAQPEANTTAPLDSASVSWYPDSNYRSVSLLEYRKDPGFRHRLVTFLNQVRPPNGVYFLYCNAVPHYEGVQAPVRLFLQPRLRLSEAMQAKVVETMQARGLRPRGYTVVHVRTGDAKWASAGAETGTAPAPSIQRVMRVLERHLGAHIQAKAVSPIPCVLLSDHDGVKKACQERFPWLHIGYYPIAHAGKGGSPEAMQHTMMDFVLLTQAQRILCLTPFNWGSGFSEYAARLYQVPYQRVILGRGLGSG